ncbi:MAG: hypothetical protein GY702_10265, partial [Desulfobulbaceae bacterium]|nr:hypothetical protein [Desulfobulbaceae bacterium]
MGDGAAGPEPFGHSGLEPPQPPLPKPTKAPPPTLSLAALAIGLEKVSQVPPKVPPPRPLPQSTPGLSPIPESTPALASLELSQAVPLAQVPSPGTVALSHGFLQQSEQATTPKPHTPSPKHTKAPPVSAQKYKHPPTSKQPPAKPATQAVATPG